MSPDTVKAVLDAWLYDHRDYCHDPGCAEPLGLLAWLAHCHGVRVEHAGQFQDYLARYEATCPNCQHKRN